MAFILQKVTAHIVERFSCPDGREILFQDIADGEIVVPDAARQNIAVRIQQTLIKGEGAEPRLRNLTAQLRHIRRIFIRQRHKMFDGRQVGNGIEDLMEMLFPVEDDVKNFNVYFCTPPADFAIS